MLDDLVRLASDALPILLFWGSVTLWMWKRLVRSLHILQLEGYSNRRFLAWLFRDPWRHILSFWVSVPLLMVLGVSITPGLLSSVAEPTHLLFVATAITLIVFLTDRRPDVKKPLILTGRASRLLALAVLIHLSFASASVVSTQFAFLGSRSVTFDDVSAVSAVALAVTQLAPFLVICSNVLLYPVQQVINWLYLSLARRKLKAVNPFVISVTGSYGKTSTKFFLGALLARRYRTLITPESYNTLLGISRAINERLEADHEVFVVEMGAYRRGDIRELADFVKPSAGVITAIGAQHLERFGSLAAIERTKYELIESLPRNGFAVFNYEDERCRLLADRTERVRVLRYGVDSSPHSLYLRAEGIVQDSSGLRFMLVDAAGASVEVRIRVWGRHNVYNFLAAACVAVQLGLSLEEVAASALSVAPVPHRLEVTRRAGITVVDDAYNSNPVGALHALEVLRELGAKGCRVLVTPGIVELGEREWEENLNLGQAAARVCDYVVLVGPDRAKPLVEGLRRAGFPGERIHIVNSLREGSSLLRDLLKPEDVVLFENDLPDQYESG